eukprot:g2241.t1
MISPSSDELPGLKRWMPIDAELKWVFKEHKKQGKGVEIATVDATPNVAEEKAEEHAPVTAHDAGGSGEIDSGWPFKRQDLIDFYEMHDPTKIPYIDQIFIDYEPNELLQALREKYGSTPMDLTSGPKIDEGSKEAEVIDTPRVLQGLGLSGTAAKHLVSYKDGPGSGSAKLSHEFHRAVPTRPKACDS